METLKVLIFGRDNDTKIILSQYLRSFEIKNPLNDNKIDFEISEAETEDETFKLMADGSFRLLIIEDELPKLTPFELLKRINISFPELHVILATKYASPDSIERAIKNGVYDFITLPIDPDRLKCIIENIFRQLTYRQLTGNTTGAVRSMSAQFIAILSHELKSHINIIEGYLSLAKEKMVIDSVGDYPEMVNRSLDRIRVMRNLVTDIFDIVRIESGIKKRNIRCINVYPVAKQSIDLFEPLCSKDNISICLNGNENITMDADTQELEIIFNNLLSNAMKYNKKGGRIEVNITSSHDQTVISVADTGIGMQKNDISKIFHDFVRIKSGQTDKISGTGLGLAIVKRVANLYNADINVESEPDKGSVFTIIFPALKTNSF